MYTKRKLVSGIGINDANYVTQVRAEVDGVKTRVEGCPFYYVWKSMLARCYSKGYKLQFPTYEGCTVCDEWLTFSNYRAWMETQDWEGKQLDKDILVPGNKLYSPDTCVFVDAGLNSFLVDCGRARSNLPTGVSRSKRRFRARCSNPFTHRREDVGYYATAGDAYTAWRQRKHELACQYADMQTDPRVAEALRIRFAPQE